MLDLEVAIKHDLMLLLRGTHKRCLVLEKTERRQNNIDYCCIQNYNYDLLGQEQVKVSCFCMFLYSAGALELTQSLLSDQMI